MSGWAANIADNKVGKHTLIVIRPRIRVTGWTEGSSQIWSAPFSFGTVTRVWAQDGNELTEVSAVPSAGDEFWYDRANSLLYVGLQYANAGSGPDDATAGVGKFQNAYGPTPPGLTVEFELNISDQAFIGPRDPTDAGSEHVNWVPAIASSPLAQIGAKDTLYGFLPMNQGVLTLKNNDGWMNAFLYAASFNRGLVKAFILANDNLYDGVVYAEVKEIFRGYTSGMKSADFTVTIQCTDFISFFDKQVELRRVTDIVGTYSSIEPQAIVANQEWFIPRVFGIHKAFKPINIDYSASPSTSNNRKWLTHERDFALDGSNQDDGDLSYTLDHLAANSGTRTYFTTTPKVRVGDTIIIQRSGTDRYAIITAVNRGSKYIDHDAIAGSVVNGDVALRYFIGAVHIKDPDGNLYDLKAGRDFSRIVDNTNDVRGFQLINNVESGFLSTPFDPSSWQISCVLYGRRELDTYSDSSDVSTVVTNGGVAARAVTALYRLLRDAGLEEGDIAETLFQAVEGASYSIGLAIPASRTDTTAPIYRDVISNILNSNLYKIAVMEESSELKLGVTEIAPFATSGDYSADEKNHKGIEFEHDYQGVVSSISLKYNHFEVDTKSIEDGIFDGREYITEQATSLVARDVHGIAKEKEIVTLLTDSADAAELAARFSYLLGDRRGYWTFDFELPYVDKTNLGATYRISRQHMPGFSFVENTQRERELIVTEVNKNSRSVSITFEDQKGVQDNSANW